MGGCQRCRDRPPKTPSRPHFRSTHGLRASTDAHVPGHAGLCFCFCVFSVQTRWKCHSVPTLCPEVSRFPMQRSPAAGCLQGLPTPPNCLHLSAWSLGPGPPAVPGTPPAPQCLPQGRGLPGPLPGRPLPARPPTTCVWSAAPPSPCSGQQSAGSPQTPSKVAKRDSERASGWMDGWRREEHARLTRDLTPSVTALILGGRHSLAHSAAGSPRPLPCLPMAVNPLEATRAPSFSPPQGLLEDPACSGHPCSCGTGGACLGRGLTDTCFA